MGPVDETQGPVSEPQPEREPGVQPAVTLLDKQAFLKSRPLRYEDVTIPEWSDDPDNPVGVRVREMDALTKSRLDRTMIDYKKGKGGRLNTNVNINALQQYRFKVVAASLVDGNDQLMFKEDETHHLHKLGASVIDRIFQAARRVSRITDEDVDDLEGNSEETDSDDSSSDSP